MVPRQLEPPDLLWIKKEYLACGKVLQSKCFMVIGHVNWRVALSLENFEWKGAAFFLNFCLPLCVWFLVVVLICPLEVFLAHKNDLTCLLEF